MSRSRNVGEYDLQDWTYEFLAYGVRADKSNPENWWLCFAMDHGVGLEEVWHKYGDEVLKSWIAEHPLTRPWSWWLVDAPEPRKRLVPDKHYWKDWKKFSHGIPENRRDSEKEFETEAQYLERLGLLTESEKKLLKIKI